ncbi:hypothetical protein Q3G72_027184 [Acer saccharum]|nr:hypothetical protein Q3G72_027184 [Acer saccharum]
MGAWKMRSRYVLPFIQNLQHMVYTNFHVTLRELAPGLFSIPAGQFQVFLDEASLPDFLYEFDIYDSIWMNDRIHMNMIEEQMNSFVSRCLVDGSFLSTQTVIFPSLLHIWNKVFG